MRSVRFDVATRFDSGIETSVAVTQDDLVIELHTSEATENDLYYHLGRINVGYVDFSASHKVGSGRKPSVTADIDRNVVEVHEVPNDKKLLGYRIGEIADNAVRWQQEVRYDDSGRDPSVAITGTGIVVSVNVDGGSDKLVYRTGRATRGSQRLSGFDTRRDVGVTGNSPSVAVNDNGFVVAVYGRNDDSGDPQVQAIVGQLNSNLTIRWGSPLLIGGGYDPAVALTDDGIVIETHTTPVIANPRILSRTGSLNGPALTINFDEDSVREANTLRDANLDPDAEDVAVATNNRLAVETFTNLDERLGVSASVLMDRAAWMTEQAEFLGPMTLRDISIPGSHDAGTYEIHDCSDLGNDCNSRTQTARILEQLTSGVRYFDIRPVYYKGALTTGHFGDAPVVGIHGCNGAPLEDVLSDVATFMARGSHELVLLKFSHYYDRDRDKFEFTNEQFKKLIDAVSAKLKSYYYTPPLNNPASTRLATLVGSKGIVIPLFDLFPRSLLEVGTFLYGDVPANDDAPLPDGNITVYDRYAEENSVGAVKSDQVKKLTNLKTHRGDLFLFSWTLTLSVPQQGLCLRPGSPTTVVDIATEGNVALAKTVNEIYPQLKITRQFIPNIVYHDLASDFATDVAWWVTYKLRRDDFLRPDANGFLVPGDSIYSSDGKVRLTYQGNGDLVLFNNAGTQIWHSNTSGSAWRCIMQTDGNFVIYDKPYHQVFATNTERNPGAFLKVQNDNRLAIYNRGGDTALKIYP